MAKYSVKMGLSYFAVGTKTGVLIAQILIVNLFNSL